MYTINSIYIRHFPENCERGTRWRFSSSNCRGTGCKAREVDMRRHAGCPRLYIMSSKSQCHLFSFYSKYYRSIYIYYIHTVYFWPSHVSPLWPFPGLLELYHSRAWSGLEVCNDLDYTVVQRDGLAGTCLWFCVALSVQPFFLVLVDLLLLLLGVLYL